MHKIALRAPTDKERKIIRNTTAPFVGSCGCLVIIFGIVPAVLLWFAGGWIGSFFSSQGATVGRWLGVAASALICLCTLVSFNAFCRRQRGRAIADAGEHTVECIDVSEARVVELHPISDADDPSVAFDIGDGKILLLRGQWLRDEDTYGAPALEGDPFEQFLNGLPEPYSFPSTAFEVARLRHSGKVLGIVVKGEYLAPEKEVDALRREYEIHDSEMLDGSLDRIAELLQKAALRTSGGPRRE